MEIEFKSLDELKKRVTPALKLRKRELKKQGINLTEDEIWNCLSNLVWKKSYNLSLAKMVNDILSYKIEQKVLE